MIHIDLSKLQQFVSVPYEMELAPRLHIVHGHLQKGNGAGGEFTGWVHLPESYDRAEFARIEQAAQKIRSDSQALVVIGIGGSYLGARGVIECLCSPNYNLKKKEYPQHLFHRQRSLLRPAERDDGAARRRGLLRERDLEVRHDDRAGRGVPVLPPPA